MHFIFEPGFFSSSPVQVALTVGAIVAVVSAVVGVFTVMRGQSFAGHALTDIATSGGSAAYLLGMSPVLGFVGGGVIGSGAMDLIGVQRVRNRDLATGVVLGAAIGLSALFLYLSATSTANTGTTQHILFGSIFTVERSTIPVVAGLGGVTIAALGFLWRPLVLSAVSPDLAAARGVPVRLVGLGFLTCLAVAVGISAIAIGSILSTALLIGPPATALRLTRRLTSAVCVASVIGVAATFLGVLFAYDSYFWEADHSALPVSFFIVAVTFFLYLLSGLAGRVGRARHGVTRPAAAGAAAQPRWALRADAVGHRDEPKP